MAAHHYGVLRTNIGGGPHGLGDPHDRTLRQVEREIMIPQKMKEIAKKENCNKHVVAFGECAKQSGLLMPIQCKELSRELHTCLSNMYKDEAFIERCTKEYLDSRSEYRRTGIKDKMRRV